MEEKNKKNNTEESVLELLVDLKRRPMDEATYNVDQETLKMRCQGLILIQAMRILQSIGRNIPSLD